MVTTFADQLVSHDGGILAADESPSTMGRRFGELPQQIDNTPENRAAYRHAIFTTPYLRDAGINGVIVSEETLTQVGPDGRGLTAHIMDQGIVVIAKIDGGLGSLLPQGSIADANWFNEQFNLGADEIRVRAEKALAEGAMAAKFRSLTNIRGSGYPTPLHVMGVAFFQARTAEICRRVGLIPIVEPEVEITGDHTIGRCKEVTGYVLSEIFDLLDRLGFDYRYMLLKPNMVTPGASCPEQVSDEEIARVTISCFNNELPGELPGVVFLSGGQPDGVATARLSVMNQMRNAGAIISTTKYSFSFGREFLSGPLRLWAADPTNTAVVHEDLRRRVDQARMACRGLYVPEAVS